VENNIRQALPSRSRRWWCREGGNTPRPRHRAPPAPRRSASQILHATSSSRVLNPIAMS